MAPVLERRIQTLLIGGALFLIMQSYLMHHIHENQHEYAVVSSLNTLINSAILLGMNETKWDYPVDQHKYVWLHIPKTGGLTGYSAFMQPLEESGVKVFPPKTSHSWNAPGCAHPLKNLSYGGSHCSRSELLDCLTRTLYPSSQESEYRFMTILRDPVERVISEYFWWRSTYGLYWTKSMNDKDEMLGEWIRDSRNVAHNRQARNILMEDVAFRTECASYNATDALEWTRQTYGSVSDFNAMDLGESIEDVMKVLTDKFHFIAVLEEMKLSRLQFTNLFGVESNRTNLGRIHSIHRHQKVTEEQRKMILERNQLDMKLYTAAKALLYRQTGSNQTANVTERLV